MVAAQFANLRERLGCRRLRDALVATVAGDTIGASRGWRQGRFTRARRRIVGQDLHTIKQTLASHRSCCVLGEREVGFETVSSTCNKALLCWL